MDIYTRMILQFAHALHRIDRRTEIFFFSTELSRATLQFDVSDVNSALARIPELTSNWGGGTRIGHCLRIFNESYAKRMLSTRDIVIIFSDGWDRGEIDVLETQMARLKRKTY
ncbi:MAG: VWA domain-containing protein, partial [Desulfobacterales bacterium]